MKNFIMNTLSHIMSQWAGRIERMTQTSIDTNVYSEAEQGNDHLKDLHLVVKIILN